MKIKIIGSNSSNRKKKKKNVMKVIESLEKNIDIEILDSAKDILNYLTKKIDSHCDELKQRIIQFGYEL